MFCTQQCECSQLLVTGAAHLWGGHAVFCPSPPHVLDVHWPLSAAVLCVAAVPPSLNNRNNAQTEASRALRQRDSGQRQWLARIQLAQLLLH